MGLSIYTTPAKLEYESRLAKLELTTQNARLELSQKPPVINIDSERPVVIINQYPCFAEEGLKNNFDLIKENSDLAHSKVMEYISKKAQDGDAMAKICHKASIMLDIIKRDSITMHEFDIGTIPMSRPEIDVQGGNLRFDAEFRNNIGEINGVTGTYTPGELDFDYIPWNLNIRVQSYGSIDIKYTGNSVDTYI